MKKFYDVPYSCPKLVGNHTVTNTRIFYKQTFGIRGNEQLL